MANTGSNGTNTLLVRSGSRCCALPLENVAETMRPLPIRPVQNMPSFVQGLATIRGSLVPVVDLGLLFGTPGEVPNSRFVLLRLGERRVALGVDAVLSVRRLDISALQNFPPLLQDAYAELVTAIEVRDEQLLYVLRSANIVPDDVWQSSELSKVTS